MAHTRMHGTSAHENGSSYASGISACVEVLGNDRRDRPEEKLQNSETYLDLTNSTGRQTHLRKHLGSEL
jgi:hypothetical protein